MNRGEAKDPMDAFDEAIGLPTGDCASCGHPAYLGATRCHCPNTGPIQARAEPSDASSTAANGRSD